MLQIRALQNIKKEATSLLFNILKKLDFKFKKEV